ncbi:MAG: hypothetical protein ACHQ9S_18885 [Candidatus Binatia bacterium]
MASIKIQNFAGIAPRYSARLLPQNGAVTASNAKLLSGELRGLHEAQLLFDFNTESPANPVQRAYRLPQNVNTPIPMQGGDSWIGFYDANVDFVRTPVSGDSFERYYWTGNSYQLSGVPQYSTRALIQSHIATIGAPNAFQLGIPTPINAPRVTPPGGINLTRAYVYTFVSAYGEEGPPSNPTQATGTLGAWVIDQMDNNNVASPYYNPLLNPGVHPEFNITTIRIYRTVTGTTQTEYYHVADVAVGSLPSYSDSIADATVALNYTLPSLTWTPPPATLKGLVAHPGGFLVGFSGRDLYLSEPYQPHAWPVQYIQTMQTEIVGVAIFNNCIVVCTTSHPYVGTGMSPLAMTMQKLDSIDPCVSRRSIATTLAGVYYASPQGIIKNDSTISTLSTEKLFTREEWQNYFSPTNVYAVPYGLQYIAFDSTSAGFIFSPAEQLAPLTQLDRFSFVTAIQQDAYTGDVYLVQNNQASLWDPPSSIPYTYTWLSKEFDVAKPVNFGAYRVKYNVNPYNVSAVNVLPYQTFNNAREPYSLGPAGSLNALNWGVLNGARVVAGMGTLPQIKNPLGGSPLYNISYISNPPPGINVQIWARVYTPTGTKGGSTWVLQYAQTITDEAIHRLPAGFKSDVWQIQLIGNANVYSFSMAETPKELVND